MHGAIKKVEQVHAFKPIIEVLQQSFHLIPMWRLKLSCGHILERTAKIKPQKARCHTCLRTPRSDLGGEF